MSLEQGLKFGAECLLSVALTGAHAAGLMAKRVQEHLGATPRPATGWDLSALGSASVGPRGWRSKAIRAGS